VDAAQVRISIRHPPAFPSSPLDRRSKGLHMRSIDAVPLPGGKLRIPVHPWLFRRAGNRRIGPPGAHRLSLIRSLIQLRPPGFTWPLSAVPTQVADGDDRRRTRIHRLGKRVGGNPSRVRISYPPPALTSRTSEPAHCSGWPCAWPRAYHQRQGRVTRVVQGDPPQPGPPDQAPRNRINLPRNSTRPVTSRAIARARIPRMRIATSSLVVRLACCIF
jgi:hypothetical protein